MAKKAQQIPNNNHPVTRLELSEAEAQVFDPELVAEKKKAQGPAYIKALNKELLRRGPYAVFFQGKKVQDAGTRREAYDRALEINEKHGYPTNTVEEKFD